MSGIVKQDKPSMVNHPSHYGGDVPYEVVKVLLAWEEMFPSLTWDVLTGIKYLPRYAEKNADIDKQIEDLDKAIWYIENRKKILLKKKANGLRAS